MAISSRLLMLWVLRAFLWIPITADAFSARGVWTARRQVRCSGRRGGCFPNAGTTSVGLRRSPGVLREGAEGAEGAGPGVAGGTSVEEACETLRQAADTRSAPKEEVSSALEILAGDSFRRLEVSEVEGAWELIFSTQLGSGYMPVREVIGFYPSREEIAIDTTIGPLPLGGVRGECSWNGGPSNELAFVVSTVKFGPLTFPREPKLKTYSFFLSREELLAARSSAGSLSLLRRVQ